MPALSMEFDPDNGQIVLEGYKVLTSGWMDVFAGQFAWLANLALAVVLIGLASGGSHNRLIFWASVLLALLTLDALDLLLRPNFYGHPQFLAGAWLWMANNLCVAIVSAFLATRKEAISE